MGLVNHCENTLALNEKANSGAGFLRGLGDILLIYPANEAIGSASHLFQVEQPILIRFSIT